MFTLIVWACWLLAQLYNCKLFVVCCLYLLIPSILSHWWQEWDYIFEPSRGDDDRFGAPYSINRQGAVLGECWIKVVNLGDTEEKLCDGYELGKLCQIKGMTWQRVRNSFYWKGMKDDVAVFVRECDQTLSSR